MNKLFGLTKRNLLVYFKDKTSVFFSVLTPIIIFALYVLFLKDTYVSQIQDSAKGLESFIDISDIENLTGRAAATGLSSAAFPPDCGRTDDRIPRRFPSGRIAADCI